MFWVFFSRLRKKKKNRYTADDAVGDLVAGVTVGLTVIPQALAYAGIAGLDPAVSLQNQKLILKFNFS